VTSIAVTPNVKICSVHLQLFTSFFDLDRSDYIKISSSPVHITDERRAA